MYLCRRVTILRMFPMVPMMTVMKVSMPDMRNLYRSVTSEYSSGLPHLSTIVAGNI